MTAATITGYERNIGDIFSDEFVFSIPHYQRPYAWTTENVEELLNDLEDYLETDQKVEDINPYFLGSIVLIKGISPESKVVDGQQRLTTLTILFSVLRSLAADNEKTQLNQFIYEVGNQYKGTQDRPRLELRERDRLFFEEHIQKNTADMIARLEKLEPKRLETDSQRNIRANALHLHTLLKDRSAQERQRLGKFIGTRCYMVVVAAPEQDTAYRVFSVLNKRGLDLAFTDILKADILGKVGKEKETLYTQIWEDREEELGRDAFADLFAHLRMIYRKVKQQGTTLQEIQTYIKPEAHPIDFIQNILVPRAKAFSAIKTADYEGNSHTKDINDLFRFLNKIDNVDWLPPAILYLSSNPLPQACFDFFTDLERLAASMMIQRAKVNDRLQRYGRLLSAIENQDDLYALGSPLQLTPDDAARTLEGLAGDIYNQKFARYVLLRLNSFLSEGEATYHYEIISIEHVLPQNPAPTSQWLKLFTDPDLRYQYTHCLANLALLSHRKNSQASNLDFEPKKDTYLGKKGTSFVLTQDIIRETEWTPAVLDRRQEASLATLAEGWRLYI